MKKWYDNIVFEEKEDVYSLINDVLKLFNKSKYCKEKHTKLTKTYFVLTFYEKFNDEWTVYETYKFKYKMVKGDKLIIEPEWSERFIAPSFFDVYDDASYTSVRSSIKEYEQIIFDKMNIKNIYNTLVEIINNDIKKHITLLDNIIDKETNNKRIAEGKHEANHNKFLTMR